MYKTLCFLVSVLFIPGALWCQAPGGSYGAPGGMNPANRAELNIEKTIWHVFGKVTDIKGDTVRDASVVTDLGLGTTYKRSLTTDFQGEFRTDYRVDASTMKDLGVRVAVRAPGYHDAYEFVNFGAGDKTWEIDITMRPATEGAGDLNVESLVETLAPPLASNLQKDPALARVKKDLDRGATAFLAGHAVAAVPNLQKVVDRNPDCGHCRTLLGLVFLDAGSWNSAEQQFLQADKLAQSKGSSADKAESFLIVAEMANWKGEYDKAAGFLMQAKDLDPKNAFILQELGRTLIFQKNWEAADQYLDEATHAGAPKESLLLRVRALLEEGDPSTAAAVMKAYIGKGSVSGLPPNVRSLNSQVEARLSLQNATQVQSVVTQPLPELIAAVPELKGLEPAANQDELGSILQKTGGNVREFFTGFQNTVSVEQVREERLGKNGKVRDFQNLKFQYLLVSQPQQGRMELQEYRTDEHGYPTAPTGLDSGFMLTSGFASASLLFHPAYQSGARFRYLGRQNVNGKTLDVVAFAEIPDKAEMIERFNTHDASVLVVFQGLAWIDADSYKIVRLRTDLLKPESKIRLERQTTEITYDPVQFKQVASTVWLPSEVAVTVEWAGKTFRNMHRYSDFRLFNTGTEEHVKPVKMPNAETPAPAAPELPNQPAAQSPGSSVRPRQ
ncbi:MAG TPA: tetratricopeptide repeat protein [Terriglobia bacterium]|nr:tetratricopeptide repeat protein [Terriglobia bacterium]